MTEPPSDTRAAARKHIEERRGFVPHLIVYVVINAGLVFIWLGTGSQGFFWPGIVLLMWGVGVLMHAWNAFFSRPVTDDDIDREIQRLRRDRRSDGRT